MMRSMGLWGLALVCAVGSVLDDAGAATRTVTRRAATRRAPAKSAKKTAAKKLPAKKVGKVAAKPTGGKKVSLGAVFLRRGLGRWRKNQKLADLLKSFKFAKLVWKRDFPAQDSSLRKAKAIAVLGAAALGKLTVDTMARVLFVLEQESPGEARSFQGKLRSLRVERRGKQVDIGPDVIAQAAFYRELYDVPCQGKLSRQGSTWPPSYACSDRAEPPTGEPVPFISLRSTPRTVAPLSEADDDKKAPKGSSALANERKRLLAERDRGDPDLLKLENLAARPSQFCVKGRCLSSYDAVANAIYGSGAGRQSLPVFCVPAKVGGKWETAKVQCSAQWLDTLGGWQPWRPDGEPSAAPDEGVIPPFACFGSPHLIKEHMIVPGGAEAGGFHCRNRIFRILSKKAEKSAADVNRNIALMCAEMRMQVWGEKYPGINQQYQAWCRQDPVRVKKGVCLPPGTPLPGDAGAPPLPFMFLSREELMFFFGHKDLFCRADRMGLVHFLYNKEWAHSFTCAVPRGLLESGPFEEGVQTCALSPFVGDEIRSKSALRDDDMKARLHCWKFNRPTCEDLSNPETAEKKDSLWRSNVFDVFDALQQARRSQHKDAWSLFDMKDAEKLADFEDKLAFADQGKDESTFGVKEFCRFVGDRRHIQCGFTKKTMAQWFELRATERPEGCATGICARGAFRRGYFCSLMSASDLFAGKPHWMCGIDIGVAGRGLLKGARAICVGGARAKRFLSAKGDKSSLQCYERRFRWGESEASEDVIREFSWKEAVQTAAKINPRYEAWLHGAEQAREWSGEKPKMPSVAKGVQALVAWAQSLGKTIGELAARPGHVRDAREDARKHLASSAEKDERDLVSWAAKYGHTLGHKTSLRLALVRSKIPVIAAFKKLKFKAEKGFHYQPLGCKGKHCFRLEFQGEAKEEARNKDKAKALTDLVAEVAGGSRPADGKWYQEFRIEATEDGQMRIDPKHLEIALRVHHLFEVLAVARMIVLRQARRYADQVFKAAARAPLLSRIEMHERARGAPIPWRLKGNVFCVSDPGVRTRSGLPEYVCASSPLLVAGAVERRVERRMSKRGKGDPFGLRRDQQLAKVRNKLKFGWCYGGVDGWPLFGHSPSKALSTSDVSSPFEMEIPPSVSSPAFRIKKPGGKRARVLQRLRRGVAEAAGATAAEAAYLIGAPAKAKPKAKPKAAAKKPGVKLAGLFKNLKLYLEVTPLEKRKSVANWIKCTGFQYSDEIWEGADPAREPKRKGAETKTAGPAAPSGGDPRAGKQTAKIMKEVGGLVVSVVKFVLPKFGDALQRVQDLAHAATDLYDKYVKKFVDIATKLWEAAKGNVQKAKELVSTLREKIGTALDDARKAAVNAAKPQPSEQALAKAKQAEADADGKVKDLRNQLQAAEKAVDATIKNSQKQVTIPDSGALISPLLEDLVTMATKRVSGVIEPNARSLLSKGFKFLRNFLDPIAQSVISALAGIPFVGAGLAALGQVAYSLAMGALEDAAGNALMGVIERLLSKLMRGVMSPVLKVAMGKILQLATRFCSAVMGEHSSACPKEVKFAALPPKDRWINRALACRPRPVIDDRVMRESALAQLNIMRTAVRMRRRVAVYARDLADRYLARYGLTYDTWMAAVGPGAHPAYVAKATAIRKDLLEEAGRLRNQMRR